MSFMTEQSLCAGLVFTLNVLFRSNVFLINSNPYIDVTLNCKMCDSCLFVLCCCFCSSSENVQSAYTFNYFIVFFNEISKQTFTE